MTDKRNAHLFITAGLAPRLIYFDAKPDGYAQKSMYSLRSASPPSLAFSRSLRRKFPK
jgi:hypothetical protein